MEPRREGTRMARKVIYRLKRDYGFSITIYKIASVTLDLETGAKTRRVRYKRVNRAVFVTAKLFRSFVYDLSYIAEAKNFTSGAFFDAQDRVLLIDWQDVRNFEITPDDYIIYGNEQYLVTQSRIFEHTGGYLVRVRKVTGSEVVDPLFDATSVITITQTAVADAIP